VVDIETVDKLVRQKATYAFKKQVEQAFDKAFRLINEEQCYHLTFDGKGLGETLNEMVKLIIEKRGPVHAQQAVRKFVDATMTNLLAGNGADGQGGST
jgi:hypothetical protein